MQAEHFAWLCHREEIRRVVDRCDPVQACDHHRLPTALDELQCKAIVCEDSRCRSWEHKRSRCSAWKEPTSRLTPDEEGSSALWQ
ncbi:MAG: hypothetical protein E6J34_16400 [Chloroflexi bacterium]|nr:MAG: hypothetical protein E6J34_16400 [Chloroflexota bacterium]